MTVIAFGGSLVAPPEPIPDPDYVGRLADAIASWSQKGPVRVVVGGGAPARRAINAAKAAGVTDVAALDIVGIAATRLNATLVAQAVASRGISVHEGMPIATAEAASATEGVVVMGGTDPGHSTDQVAAELAIALAAPRLVIATNVDGVYTADPRTDPEARRIESLTFEELAHIIGETEWKEAGQSGVIDGPATDIILRHRLTTCVVHGGDLDNVARAVTGDAFNGTLIQ